MQSAINFSGKKRESDKEGHSLLITSDLEPHLIVAVLRRMLNRIINLVLVDNSAFKAICLCLYRII